MVGETEVFRAASGDFNATLIAFLAVSIVIGAGFILRWMMCTVKEQMAADREMFREALTEFKEGLKEMAQAIRDSSKDQAEKFDKCFLPHDSQAKDIKKVVDKTAIVLDSRPCINGKIRE